MLFDQEWLEKKENSHQWHKYKLMHIHEKTGRKGAHTHTLRKKAGMEAMKEIAEEDNRMFGNKMK